MPSQITPIQLKKTELHVHLEKDISLSVILNSHKVVSIRLFFELRIKSTMINAQMKKMDTMLA